MMIKQHFSCSLVASTWVPRMNSESLVGAQGLRWGVVETLFGRAEWATWEGALCWLSFVGESVSEAPSPDLIDFARRASWTLEKKLDASQEVISLFERLQQTTSAQTRATSQSGDVHILLVGTPFQCQVWSSLISIAIGSTLSYGEVAKRVGAHRAYRAVGRAIGANPIAWFVPCHRVLPQKRTPKSPVGHYRWGSSLKNTLLEFSWFTLLRNSSELGGN